MTNKRSRRSGAGREDQPTWQPVAAAGVLTSVVAEQLAHTRSQLTPMQQARPSRPDARILDDHTVSETLRVYGQMADDYRTLFAEQGRRWQADTTLTTTSRGVHSRVRLSWAVAERVDLGGLLVIGVGVSGSIVGV